MSKGYKPKKDLLAIDRARQVNERGKTDLSKLSREIITRATGDNIYKLVLFWIRYAPYNCTELVPLTGYEIRPVRYAIDKMMESHLKNYIIKSGTKTNRYYTIRPELRFHDHESLFATFKASHLPERIVPSVRFGDINGWEAIVMNILVEECGRDWKYTGAGDTQEWVGRFSPDFLNDDLKGIIEVHGPEHEQKNSGNTKEKEEAIKRIPYAKRGYQTLFLWGNLFTGKNWKTRLKNTIKSWDEKLRQEVING